MRLLGPTVPVRRRCSTSLRVPRLMVSMLFTPDMQLICEPGFMAKLYDPAAGTGGMLSAGIEYAAELNDGAMIEVYGQELNEKTYAICKSDTMIKGKGYENIHLGNSFTDDALEHETFHYMLCNPPFGVEWKKYEKFIRDENECGHAGRFGAGLPRVSDGSLLFLQHMISKMLPIEEGGCRLAIVFNGSPLFTGDAGSGESEIRKWIIESGWLETVIAMPDQLFYNTGILTYVWIVTNRKKGMRKGKIQLIDGTSFFERMRKPLGEKRKLISEEQIKQLTEIYGDFVDGEFCKVFDEDDFAYWKVTVERPLRLNFQATAERIERIREQTAFAKLAISRKRNPEEIAKDVAEGKKLQASILAAVGTIDGSVLYKNRADFTKLLAKAFKKAGLDVKTPLLKAIKAEAVEKDIDEVIADEIAAHGSQANLSFFAFTATPKQKTLEIFGKRTAAGKPEPFHLYSMRQAIEEGFIFNVLENYTTYETYFQIGKKIAGDPVYGKNLANKALGKYMSLHPHNLAQKAEVIIEHFRSQVQHRISGQAKAMLVTGSRLHAVRYFFEFQKYIKKMHYELGILVAFSGTVKDNVSGEIKEYTESNLNGFPDTETVKKFDTAEYQILIVAEKYQTGFDQPVLHTMYVDKKLSGIKAIQTLSRINRSCRGKTETFILDFVNSREDIEKAFQDYYQATGVVETTDPNTIYDIKNVLDSFMVYTDSEIDNFAKVFFKESKLQSNIDLAKLNGSIDPAVDRYNALTEEQDRIDFKGALAKFIRLYAFLTHIINLGDASLHKFHAYAKCLLRKLPRDDTERTPDIGSDVMLQYYRVQKVSEGALILANEDGLLKSKTSGTSLPLEDEKEVLSAIIQSLNERLGTNFTEMDKVLEQFVQDMADNEEMVLRSKNPLDLFKIIYDNTIMDVVLGRMAKNQEFCEKYLEDDEFRREVDKILLPLVHERLSKMDDATHLAVIKSDNTTEEELLMAADESAPPFKAGGSGSLQKNEGQ
jgi:hypothetical protein